MIKQKLSILTKGLTLLRPSLRHKLSFPFSSVDQSLYYRPKVPVISFLNTHSLQHKESTQHYRIKYCPFCPKPHYEQPSNLYTLNIHKDSGVYFCFRCSAKGSWLDFQKNLLGITIHPMMDEGDHNASADNNIHSKISDAEYFIYRENLYSKQYQDVREYLHARGLGDDTLQAYNVGAGVETFFTRDIGQEINVKVVYFPMYRMLQKEQQKQKLLQSMNNEQSMNGEHKNANHSFNNNFTQIIKIKARGCGKENKKYMKQYPSSNLRGFFGLNVIKKEDTMVVITEGEFDAMAVYQATGIPAISLPHGAGNLPDSLLPFLDRFGKIVLWMDNDEAGRMNQEKIAYKLGVSRTHIVRKTLEDCKDANDVLLKDRNEVLAFINSARTIPDQNILQFSALRDAVRNRIFKMEEFIGVKLSWFRFFNRKVKGIRLAQLTIVSGPTGSGKTTLLSQISLQLAQYNVPVLWGSFQIRNEVLVSNMLTQFSKVNLTKHKEHFDSYADEFAHLPLYYLSFHGSHAIEKVLATISYAIEVYTQLLRNYRYH